MTDPPRWLPGRWRDFRWRDAGHDAAAGLVLSAVLVPAGMGYAAAAGLAPVTGLYASVAALVVYAAIGPSRILMLGPDSSLAPLIAATVLPLAHDDARRAASLAALLAIISGALCLFVGLARLGFVTELLSLPVRYGYLNGIALTVIASQLPKLFGVSSRRSGLIGALRDLVDGLRDEGIQWRAFAVGVAVLAVIVGLGYVAPKVPAVLIAVTGALVAAWWFELAKHGVPMVGGVPRRLPSFAWPGASRNDMGALIAGAVGIAMVSCADTSILSRAVTGARHEKFDANREFIALGAADVACGFFHGFSVSASASRTSVAQAAGARTHLTGIIGAAGVIAVLVAVPGLFRYLPLAALAAVVIGAAAKLIVVRPLVGLIRARRSEGMLSIFAFAAIAGAGPSIGVLLAIGLSLGVFIVKAWRPHTTTLVRVDGLKGYHDEERHPEGRQVPGLVLYRFDAPLFFANAEFFRSEVLQYADARPAPRWIVVTAEPITDVDATATVMLNELHAELASRGIVLAFAELKGHVRERLASVGFVDRVGPDHFYRTTGEAVRSYLAAEGVPWVDWEDRDDAPTV